MPAEHKFNNLQHLLIHRAQCVTGCARTIFLYYKYITYITKI